MRAKIVSIGTEIMLGEITDTNAAFIASQLPEFGVDLLYVATTPAAATTCSPASASAPTTPSPPAALARRPLRPTSVTGF